MVFLSSQKSPVLEPDLVCLRYYSVFKRSQINDCVCVCVCILGGGGWGVPFLSLPPNLLFLHYFLSNSSPREVALAAVRAVRDLQPSGSGMSNGGSGGGGGEPVRFVESLALKHAGGCYEVACNLLQPDAVSAEVIAHTEKSKVFIYKPSRQTTFLFLFFSFLSWRVSN